MSGPNSQNDMNYSNGSQKNQTAETKFDSGSSERSLSGNIGKFAMNQLLGGKKPEKSSGNGGGLGALAGQLLGASSHGGSSQPEKSSGSGGLGALAGQLLGASSHGGSSQSNTGVTSIAGSLVTNLLGGKKQEKPSSSTSQPKPAHGSLMSAVGGFLGKHDKPNNFGYSQNGGQQGSYSGSAPPNSYRPNSTGNFHHPPNPATSQQGEQYYSQHHNHTQQNQYTHSHSSQPHNAPPPSKYDRPSYPADNQSHFAQYQQSYGVHPPPAPPSYQATPQYNPTGSSYGGVPMYSGGHPQGDYQNNQTGQRPEHQNNQYGGYGGPNNPPSSIGSYQNQQQAFHGSPGGYGDHEKR